MHEAQIHPSTESERQLGQVLNSFITLTYDDAHLPPGGTLVVKDWQLFAKKLRRLIGPFRFFHCGEYGSVTGRPHLHAALFGEDFHWNRTHHKTTRQGHKLYISPILDQAWSDDKGPRGHAYIGELTHQSAAYIARYIVDKVTGDRAEHHYEYVHHTTGEVLHFKPEYSTMSRRPGIGSLWFDQYVKDVYPHDEVIVEGKSTQPPKFYDNKFALSNPEQWKKILAERSRKGKLRADNNTTDRLRIRETVKKASLKQLKREL